jgi:alpha,alpha-trehalase
MHRLLWDEETGYYFDYDAANQRRSRYISATGLYPLWAGLLDPTNPNELARAQRVAAFAKAKLVQKAGLAATAQESMAAATMKDARQWDYPFGWAPHQMLAWEGLARYGMRDEAEDLAYRWLYNITRNVRDHNGTIPEKYNVVTGSHDVFVEYWNVGTNFQYVAREGFGWMNASYQVGLKFLSEPKLKELREMKAPPQE